MDSELMKMLEDMRLVMKALIEDNREVRNELKALSGSRGEKSTCDSAQSVEKNVGTVGVIANAPSNDDGRNDNTVQPQADLTGRSLILGLLVYHSIGSGVLTTAEEILFEKWHRRVEKSLTGSRVKIFNGTAYITWRLMIL
jgi:hypothetical protein